MVPHQWPVALVVIWHIYSCLACSLEDSARDLPSSGKVVLGQGQVPCEFWADWPNFIFQPVAPDMIWHIYSGQCCFKGVLGMDLLSSGDVALMMGRSPVSFEQIGQPSFFSRWLLTWFGTFTHTCTAPQGMVVGTCHLQGRQPLPWDRSPVSFEQISQPSFFSWWFLMWFGTFTHTCTAPWGMVAGTCHLHRRQPLPWGRSPVSFEQIGQTSFFNQWLLTWFGTFTLGSAASRGFRYGPAVFRGCCPHHGHVSCEFWGRSANLHFSAGGSWRDLAHLLPPVLLLRGMVVGTCHLHRRQPLPWDRSPVSFEQISQPSFFSWWLLMWFGTFTPICTAPRGMVVGTCHLQGRQPLP